MSPLWILSKVLTIFDSLLSNILIFWSKPPDAIMFPLIGQTLIQRVLPIVSKSNSGDSQKLPSNSRFTGLAKTKTFFSASRTFSL